MSGVFQDLTLDCWWGGGGGQVRVGAPGTYRQILQGFELGVRDSSDGVGTGII